LDPTALTKLFELGPYGLAAAACAFAAYCLRGWQSESRARLADRDASTKQIVEIGSDAIKAQLTSANILAERTAAVRELGASNTDMVSVVKGMTSGNEVQVDRMFDRLDTLLRATERMTAALERRP